MYDIIRIAQGNRLPVFIIDRGLQVLDEGYELLLIHGRSLNSSISGSCGFKDEVFLLMYLALDRYFHIGLVSSMWKSFVMPLRSLRNSLYVLIIKVNDLLDYVSLIKLNS
jgi:hypothetical protein